MAILKSKDAAKMSLAEIREKLKDLKIEMIKIKVGKKTGKTSHKELRRAIARLMTFARIKTKAGEKAENKIKDRAKAESDAKNKIERGAVDKK